VGVSFTAAMLVATTAAPAFAHDGWHGGRGWHGGGGWHHRGGGLGVGPAIGLGLLGAAIASPYYYGYSYPYYNYGYPGYSYNYGYPAYGYRGYGYAPY
jgi:hypothetical protein